MKLLITGRPGVGKTTVIKRVAEKLGERATGFFTGEVRDAASKKRRGFSVTTIEGESAVFADVSFETSYRVSAYKVDVQRFEALALPAIEKAVKKKEGVIVIDEIGKMELFSKRFVRLVETIVKEPGLTILATVPLKNVHPLVKAIKEADDAVVMQVTEANRDGLPDEVLAQLER
jgi:nucleoside-triphosphatase